ncbi:MAG: mannosyltransferase family protein [Pirellulales bacterium]
MDTGSGIAKDTGLLREPVVAYLFTSFLVVVAVGLGPELLPESDHIFARQTPFIERFANWDGEWYSRIVDNGYGYEPGRNSSIAFFPLYPFLGWVVREVLGVTTTSALLIVSNSCLLASLILFARYQQIVHGDTPATARQSAIWMLAIFPPTFFFRMAYSESLFLLLALAALLAMHSGKSLFLTAVIIGAATAARTTGVALIVPFAIHIWRTDRTKFSIPRLAFFIGLSTWGLLAYVGYLQLWFGDGLVFLWTQGEWWMRPRVSFPRQLIGTVSLEPIWSLYLPGSDGFWQHEGASGLGVASLHFANPVWFGIILISVFFGWRRKSITDLEVAFSLTLLALSYVPKSFPMCMASQARYAAVVYPAYIALGDMLASWPSAARLVLYCAFAIGLMIYAAQFAAWYIAI